MNLKNLLVSAVSSALVLAFASCNCGADKCGAADCADSTQIVLDNIMTRSSVRNFTDRKIGKDTLEVIVRAGMAAPTAMNKQPWAFVVVTDQEVLDSLRTVHPYSNLKTAAAAIVVCGDMSKTIEGYGQHYWVQDCSAATENILLAAHAYGLGAVWCGVYPGPDRVPGVSRVLELPGGIIPLNIITMGYPAGEQQPKDKWKPENVHYQRW